MHLLIILIGILVILYLISNKAQVSSSLKKTFVCFYSNNCTHCHKLINTGKWDAVEKHFAGSNVKVLKYEETSNPEKMSQFNIGAFPTIKLIHENGQTIEYEGLREPANLISFVENN